MSLRLAGLFSLAAGRSLTTCACADGCADSNYSFLTAKERDVETGLDYFLVRSYSSTQGRFTGIDPGNYQARLDLADPQSWNAYSYVNNSPLVRVDPDGKGFFSKLKNWFLYDIWGEDQDVRVEEEKRRQLLLNEQESNGGELVIQNQHGVLVRLDPAKLTRFQVFYWSYRLYAIWNLGVVPGN